MSLAQAVFLIGISGCGKTSVARALAMQWGAKFVDTDARIEAAAGKSIARIFTDEGEAAFRALERRILCELAEELARVAENSANHTRYIIAAGGGAVLHEDAMLSLQKVALIVFLQRDLQKILQTADCSLRPLLRDEPSRLLSLYKLRLPLYERFSAVRIANNSSIENAVSAVAAVYCARSRAQLPQAPVSNHFASNASAPQSPLHFAVIGDPVAHSLSPCMQNAMLKELGVAADYCACPVRAEELPAWLASEASNFAGFNATMPHKTALCSLVAHCSDAALRCGAVNTVCVRHGELYGFTTDGIGFLRALEEQNIATTAQRVLILGAGGAASSLAVALLAVENTVTICCRSPQKAQHIATRATNMGKAGALRVVSWQEKERAAQTADICINCTPLGMHGVKDNFADLSFVHFLPRHATVCDLIYSPLETSLLSVAQKRGLTTVNGLAMLIHQGIASLEFFLQQRFTKDEKIRLVHVAKIAILDEIAARPSL